MKRAAMGIRAHSGWAAVVAVTGDFAKPNVLERRRIALVETGAAGASQPYHFARTLPLADAEAHLAASAKKARILAAKGLEEMAERLCVEGYRIAGCGLLIASGRPIPGLAETLASHAMIHSAEGEFFRNAFVDACQRLGISVAKIRERDLLDRAAKELRRPSTRIKTELAKLGRDLGPPWTQDQKLAVLAGWLLLR